MVAIDKTGQHHLVAAANDRYIWVLAAEFLVNADLDNCAVFLQHGAIRDLVPAVAIDRMSHHGATADQRCGHCGPPWGGNREPAIRGGEPRT